MLLNNLLNVLLSHKLIWRLTVVSSNRLHLLHWHFFNIHNFCLINLRFWKVSWSKREQQIIDTVHSVQQSSMVWYFGAWLCTQIQIPAQIYVKGLGKSWKIISCKKIQVKIKILGYPIFCFDSRESVFLNFFTSIFLNQNHILTTGMREAGQGIHSFTSKSLILKSTCEWFALYKRATESNSLTSLFCRPGQMRMFLRLCASDTKTF